jgi:hypothetical protein
MFSAIMFAAYVSTLPSRNWTSYKHVSRIGLVLAVPIGLPDSSRFLPMTLAGIRMPPFGRITSALPVQLCVQPQSTFQVFYVPQGTVHLGPGTILFETNDSLSILICPGFYP